MFQHFIHALVALLAFAHPIAATPLLAAITEGLSKVPTPAFGCRGDGAQFLLAEFNGILSASMMPIGPNTHSTQTD